MSSPTVIFALCQRTSWRHSLSSTLRPPAKAAVSSTPPMVLLRLLKAAQSKNTLYVLHRQPRPPPVKAPPHLPPSLLHSMELTFARTACSSLSNDMALTQKPVVGTAMLSNYILCPPVIPRPLQTLSRTHPFVGHRWTLTANGLLGTYIAPIPPSHFHSAWQDPAQPMWTNPERHGTSSASVLPTYFPNVPTARDDNLNVQADGRLAAHLRETPAPHILEEDAEPNEELTGNDFTYSHDTTTAFQELLTMIDSTTKELPDVLSTKHYAALTQLPLTYPWARLVLDMKELLLSFDRHLITCLIANQVQGNDPPHPGTVLSSFLHHLGQLILLIIAPHDTDDAPPFLQHPEIYGIEFWHAHLNYACARFAVSQGPDRLLGNQICHWTTGTSETCMKVTHLVVFLPPALGAYVLSRHRTKVSSSLSSADDISTQDGPHTLRINQSALLTPPAVLKHQAEQITNARSRAAEGSLAPYTIPLLANTQVRSSKNRVAWTLKFTLPTPAEEGTTRRFSAVPKGYGPSGAQALEGAVRYARPFDPQL